MKWGIAASLASLLTAAEAHARDLKIEIAPIAGAADLWTDTLAKGVKGLSKTTDGRVAVKFHAGADEATVVSKLLAGEIDGALLTAAGLAQLAPATRMLALPFLFVDAVAADAGRAALEPEITMALVDAGFVHVGWTDGPAIRLFLQRETTTIRHLRQRTVGVAPLDVLMDEYLAVLNVPTVAVQPADVQARLADGTIDALHSSALEAIFQTWYPQVNVQSEALWVPTGAIVIRKDAFDSLDDVDRRAVRAAVQRSAADLTGELRDLDQKFVKALIKEKVGLLILDKDLLATMKAAGEASWARRDIELTLVNKVLAASGRPELQAAQARTRVATVQAAQQTTVAAAGVTADKHKDKPEPEPKPALKAAIARGGGAAAALGAALDDAAEDLRAVRLAVDDCDASMLAEWIRFPLRVGDRNYKSAGALAKACSAGDLPKFPAAELETSIRAPALTGTDLRLHGGELDWRFVWSGRQWWLTEVAATR